MDGFVSVCAIYTKHKVKPCKGAQWLKIRNLGLSGVIRNDIPVLPIIEVNNRACYHRWAYRKKNESKFQWLFVDQKLNDVHVNIQLSVLQKLAEERLIYFK